MENRDSTPGAVLRQQQGGLSRPGPGYTSRYNPLHEMQEHMRRMDALFNRVFGYEPFPPSIRNEFQLMEQSEPDVDIYESDTEYIIHAALPGIDPQDIKLEASEDTVVLTGQRRPLFNSDSANNANNSNSADGQSGARQQTEPQAQQGSASQPGQAARQNTAPQAASATGAQAPGAATAEPAPGASGSSAPHTQHRRSRTSSQMNFRLVYTLPTQINPDNARANFRHGMLELHLPKQQAATSRTVPISIQAGNTAQQIQGTQQTVQPTANAGMHEGNPSNKIGTTFTPSAGEDHTTQAQSIGARTEHRTGRDASLVAGGQTNPMSSITPTNANTEAKSPAEANRPA